MKLLLLGWQDSPCGRYEYEHDGSNYTGWCRCKDGRMANGRWPEWNNKTGENRYT